MGSKLTFIIFLVVVAIQVISSLAQKAAKKQQQRRMQEIAEQRRRAAKPGRPGETARGTTVMRPDAGSRAEQLAARRAQQLEQLRLRRAGRGASPATSPQLRVPTSGGQPARAAGAKTRRTITILESGREAQLRSREQRRRALQLESEQQHRAAQETRRREAAREAQRLREIERKEQEQARQQAAAAAAIPPIADALYGEVRGKGDRAAGLRKALASRDTLRALFVMKELLDPPVAMREG